MNNTLDNLEDKISLLIKELIAAKNELKQLKSKIESIDVVEQSKRKLDQQLESE